ncbi:MAG: hypothetical protein FJ340_02205 [Sphingomonadales bacterium]|nr:hypothetical protein [Sphingomonadales bacterium]
MFREMIDSVFGYVVSRIIDPICTTIWKWATFLFYKTFTWQGIKIAGEWEAQAESKETTFHEVFNIKQSGFRLSGDYSVKNVFKHEGGAVNSKYKLDGKVINNYVTFICYINSHSEYGVATFILELVDGGSSLEGKSLWLDRNGRKIVYYPKYKMSRKKY